MNFAPPSNSATLVHSFASDTDNTDLTAVIQILNGRCNPDRGQTGDPPLKLNRVEFQKMISPRECHHFEPEHMQAKSCAFNSMIKGMNLSDPEFIQERSRYFQDGHPHRLRRSLVLEPRQLGGISGWLFLE
jgi:hypothetical protein